MNCKKLVILAFLPLLGCQQYKKLTEGGSSNQASVPAMVNPPAPHIERTFVCAGQSNMTGDKTTSPMQNDARISMENIEYGRFGSCWGFGLAYAEEHPEVKRLNLIQCAVGGSSIQAWSVGGVLYESCMDYIGNRQIDGVIFYQGEHNASREIINWRERFETMISDMRTRLGQNFPVVFARITSMKDGNPINLDYIRSEQNAVSLPRVRMITNDDLTLFEGWHYAPSEYQVIGQRFSEAFNGL